MEIYADTPGTFKNLSKETRCRVCAHERAVGFGASRITSCDRADPPPPGHVVNNNPASPACSKFRWKR